MKNIVPSSLPGHIYKNLDCYCFRIQGSWIAILETHWMCWQVLSKDYHYILFCFIFEEKKPMIVSAVTSPTPTSTSSILYNKRLIWPQGGASWPTAHYPSPWLALPPIGPLHSNWAGWRDPICSRIHAPSL